MPDVNELKDGEEKYKNLLVVNESEDADVTLYIYSGWSPLCATSTISKIILPKQKYLYREEALFKFQLVANFKKKQKENDKQNENEKYKENDKEMENDEEKKNCKQKENDEEKEKYKRKKKNLLGPLKLNEDKLIKITQSLECKVERLADFSNEKRVCLRKIHRENELLTGAGMPNLYDILGLDMEEIRKMEKNALKKAIKKAYHNQIRIWHPDKNFGDGEIATQIILAKTILLDDGRRASYHNGVDYDKGWFSFKRWKAILWSERYTKEQNQDFWRRIGMSAVSLGLSVGGVILSATTAGTAAPVVAMCATIFGAGCTAGGGQSLMYTVSKESIVDGCEAKQWAKEIGKGFTIGGITGGAVAAYTPATVTAGAVANAGEEGVGCASIALKNIVKRLPIDAAKAMPGKSMGAVTETTTDFINERLDDSVENQHPLEHIKTGVKNLAINVAVGSVLQGCDAAKQIIQGEKTKAECLCQAPGEQAERIPLKVIASGTTILVNLLDKSDPIKDVKIGVRKAKTTEDGDDKVKENNKSSEKTNSEHEANEPRQETSPFMEGSKAKETEAKVTFSTCDETDEEKTDEEEIVDESFPGMIKYRSKGNWFSEMIVTFILNGEKSKKKVSGDGTRVRIPADATDIEVRFKVSRPHWGFIKKYDRFGKTWFKPDEPHVFRYERPPIRTFTISGNLWWEAVMRVSNEYHEETGEMS